MGNPAAAKAGVFWRMPKESCAFSVRHLTRGSNEPLHKSDVVILQHTGAAKKNLGVAPPRYSLLCDGVEWPVAQGEHNVWECVVLFLMQRAKENSGFLGPVNLQAELYSSFMLAMTPDGVGALTPAANSVAYHGMLSVLHPWSQQIQDVELLDVSRKL